MVEGLSRASQLRLEPFIEDELIAAAAPQIAATIRNVSDIRDRAIILREEGSGTRAVVERALKKSGLSLDKLSHRVQLGSGGLVKGALVSGMGIGFLSRCSIQNELDLGKLVVIPLIELKVKRYFSWTLPAGALRAIPESFFKFANREKSRLVSQPRKLSINTISVSRLSGRRPW